MAVVPKADSRGKKEETLRVRLDGEMKKRLQAVCDETGQKMSATARFLLVAGLEAHEKGQKKR